MDNEKTFIGWTLLWIDSNYLSVEKNYRFVGIVEKTIGLLAEKYCSI